MNKERSIGRRGIGSLFLSHSETSVILAVVVLSAIFSS